LQTWKNFIPPKEPVNDPTSIGFSFKLTIGINNDLEQYMAEKIVVCAAWG